MWQQELVRHLKPRVEPDADITIIQEESVVSWYMWFHMVHVVPYVIEDIINNIEKLSFANSYRVYYMIYCLSLHCIAQNS
jgi:hypothetical protein